MILVTGANGTVGKAVLDEVVRGGAKYRALYRSGGTGPNAVNADFADKASLAPAFEGVESMFLVCSPIPQLVELEISAIETAEEAGISRIVLNSALGAGDYVKSFPSWHRRVEDRLKATKMAWSILRPNSFLENIIGFYAPSIRAQGAFYSSVGDAKFSYLGVRDIAAVAAQALAGGHDGGTFELNGPEAVTCTELADRITRRTGVAAKYVNIPVEAQRKAMLDMGMPAWQVTALLDLQAYYTAGQGGETDGLLAGLLGRAPIGLDAFLMENAGAFRAEGASA